MVRDAFGQAGCNPPVAAQFLPGRLSGNGEANLALVRRDDGETACTVSVHGGGLEFALPGEMSKSAGVPLEGKCSAALRPLPGGGPVRLVVQ